MYIYKYVHANYHVANILTAFAESKEILVGEPWHQSTQVNTLFGIVRSLFKNFTKFQKVF